MCPSPFREHTMFDTAPGESKLGEGFSDSLIPLSPGLSQAIECFGESTYMVFFSRCGEAWQLGHEDLFVQGGIQVSTFDIHLNHLPVVPGCQRKYYAIRGEFCNRGEHVVKIYAWHLCVA